MCKRVCAASSRNLVVWVVLRILEQGDGHVTVRGNCVICEGKSSFQTASIPKVKSKTFLQSFNHVFHIIFVLFLLCFLKN